MSARLAGAVTGGVLLILALLAVGVPTDAASAVAAFVFGALALYLVAGRRRAHEAAAAGELRYRSLLDHLPLVTFVALEHSEASS